MCLENIRKQNLPGSPHNLRFLCLFGEGGASTTCLCPKKAYRGADDDELLWNEDVFSSGIGKESATESTSYIVSSTYL